MGFCDGQSGAGVGFLQVLRFPLPIFIPPIAPKNHPHLSLGFLQLAKVAAVPGTNRYLGTQYRLTTNNNIPLQPLQPPTHSFTLLAGNIKYIDAVTSPTRYYCHLYAVARLLVPYGHLQRREFDQEEGMQS
jgi:hypothetical protein